MLPTYIQPVRMAERNAILTGTLPLNRFTRLLELLANDAGTVAVELRFGRDAERFHYIQGAITAKLQLECQRCLQPFAYDVQIDLNLSPVFDEAAVKKLPSRYDPLELKEDQVALVTVIEDELLLALPLVPKHKDADCASKMP